MPAIGAILAQPLAFLTDSAGRECDMQSRKCA